VDQTDGFFRFHTATREPGRDRDAIKQWNHDADSADGQALAHKKREPK
jgi:hypothetical protein